MIKVRNLTESLEKKYNLKTLNEAWEIDFDDMYDAILNDTTLSEQEKQQELDSLIHKYYSKNESLNEAGPSVDEISFNDIMDKQKTQGNMNWYKKDHPKWSQNKKTPKKGCSVKESYRFKPIPDNAADWGYDNEQDFARDILSLEDQEIVNISKATAGAPYYDITFDNGKKLSAVAQNCIYLSTDEALNEDYWDPTPWFDNLVNNYENWTNDEWNSWDQETRDREVTKAIKHFLIDNELSEQEAKEFMNDLTDNNFHTECRIFAKLYGTI